MKYLTYKVDDSILATLLGESNFSNANSALFELVKNAYDAGADNLVIRFEGDRIVVSDNGKGMTDDDIEKYWMHVGKTSKDYIELDSHGHPRVLAGSKGIGRFALARLGHAATVRSKSDNNRGVVWATDWASSTLDYDDSLKKSGTSIEITSINDRWGSRAISSLCSFLSKAYADTDVMRILVDAQGEENEIVRYFDKPKLGVNCTEVVRFSYDADNQSLSVEVQSDEFNPVAQSYVKGLDIQEYSTSLDMFDELFDNDSWDIEAEAFKDELMAVGSFNAELYFRMTGISKKDTERFEYQYRTLPSPYDSGVVLYRNAFSISSYEGAKDWLALGRRARKSPASPSHKTGSWRVRENQLAGAINIDKVKNPLLKDMANRQGLEENLQYNLFLAIIDCALKVFERYRQSIIRQVVAAKESELPESQNESVINKIASRKMAFRNFGEAEYKTLQEELAIQKRRESENARKEREAEEQYRYDVRILNVLATSGLKASSIAHQLKNDENNIMNNSRYIREALVWYGLWETVNLPDHTDKAYRNIPSLLNQGERINKQMVAFLGAMLGDIRKDRFQSTSCNIGDVLSGITRRWKRDYAQLQMSVSVPENANVALPSDAVQVVFDNLILNSLQQNPDLVPLVVSISASWERDSLCVDYQDNGVGLHKRFQDDPRRILEVHVTTRPNGHGLGMWIVNSTLLNFQSAIVDIIPNNGFSIRLALKGDKHDD